MNKYAGIFENRVIIIEEAQTAPVYPPVPNCGEVQTVPIPEGTLVSVGMHYTEEEGFTGEYAPPYEPIPEPTEQELVQAEMLLNQIEIMSRQNEQDEVLAEILLNQMGV